MQEDRNGARCRCGCWRLLKSDWGQCTGSCRQHEPQIAAPRGMITRLWRSGKLLCVSRSGTFIDGDEGPGEATVHATFVFLDNQLLPRNYIFHTRDKDLWSTLENVFKNMQFRTIISVKVANWVLKVVSVFACLINYNLFKSTLISNYCGMHWRLNYSSQKVLLLSISFALQSKAKISFH